MNYRMTINPALEAGSKTITFSFETAEQMLVAQDVSAGLLLFLADQIKVMKDYANVFYLEERIDGEWVEYEEF